MQWVKKGDAFFDSCLTTLQEGSQTHTSSLDLVVSSGDVLTFTIIVIMLTNLGNGVKLSHILQRLPIDRDRGA